jgi:hypothetical protein
MAPPGQLIATQRRPVPPPAAALLLTLFPGPRPLTFHVVFDELHRFSHVVFDPHFREPVSRLAIVKSA